MTFDVKSLQYEIISIQYIYDKRIRVIFTYFDSNFDIKTDFIVICTDCTMRELRELIFSKINGVRL